ncbi:MAG TPA: hypothetical protein PKE30_01630 [Niabella sp.]|nr:hypothetical protein [Niabella sp.]
MKRCVVGLLCVLAFSMVWISCKKNDSTKAVVPISDSLPTNEANPYDSFGYWHNVVLDSIEQQRSTRSVDGFNGSCDVIRKFYRSRNWPSLDDCHFDGIPSMVMEAAIDRNGFIDRSDWSDSVKLRLHQLFTTLVQVGSDSCSYPKLKTAIQRFEYEVLKSTLTSLDKEVLLKASSIARYSANRWIAQPNATQTFEPAMLAKVFERNQVELATPVNSHLTARTGFFEKIGKWIAVTAIDISCAIVDLSVASGVGGSDFMKEVFEIH